MKSSHWFFLTLDLRPWIHHIFANSEHPKANWYGSALFVIKWIFISNLNLIGWSGYGILINSAWQGSIKGIFFKQKVDNFLFPHGLHVLLLCDFTAFFVCFFSAEKYWYFSYFSMKTYIVGHIRSASNPVLVDTSIGRKPKSSKVRSGNINHISH